VVGGGVAEHGAGAVGGAVAGAAEHLGAAVAVEVVDEELRVVRPLADVADAAVALVDADEAAAELLDLPRRRRVGGGGGARGTASSATAARIAPGALPRAILSQAVGLQGTRLHPEGVG